MHLGPVGHQFFALEMGLPPVARRDPETNLVQPSRDRALAGEGFQATVNDQEDFLVNVLDVGWPHPHAVQRTPHEFPVAFVNLRDRQLSLTCPGRRGDVMSGVLCSGHAD